MKKLLLLTAIFLAVTFSFAQENLPPPDCPTKANELGPTIINSNVNQSGIGTIEEFKFTGMFANDNAVVIGMLKDASTGNYLFFGSTDSAATVVNNSWPGIKFYPSYNTLEVTAPIRFYRPILLTTPILKIGQEDGQSAVIPLAGTPSSSTSEDGTAGASIMFDDNFIYIKTSSGKWKRAALFDVDF